jgi:hypothetical protein
MSVTRAGHPPKIRRATMPSSTAKLMSVIAIVLSNSALW